MGSVLVIEDDPATRRRLVDGLREAGHEVVAARTPHDVREAAADHRPGVALIEARPGRGGWQEMLALLREVDPALQVVVMTGFASLEVAIEAIRVGACDYVSKPFRMEEMVRSVARALDAHAAASAASGRPRARSPAILGRGHAMQEVLRAIERFAPLEVPVLLRGETGTGKALVARTIHDSGPRGDGPWRVVNCASLEESRLAEQLFGGAKRPGQLARAAGGTLLLDEIADLPHGLQERVLRVIDSGMFRPGGRGDPVPIDVRVIAATDRDLAPEVEAGRFRRDLMYRLNAATIVLPPLHERLEDLPLLVDHLLALHARTAGGPVRALSPDAMRMLERYRWPGNLRELSHVLEHAAIAARGPRIEVEDLPPQLADAQGAPPAAAGSAAPLSQRLEDIEKAHVLAVLGSVGGSRSRAATILGIDRKTLYRKLVRWGVQHHEE